MDILELRHLRNNVHLQCIPTVLFVVLKNQFEREKRTHVQPTFDEIKKWVDWGEKSKRKSILSSGRDVKYFNEMFYGNSNIDTFHTELNSHIGKFNIKLQFKSGFTSNDIKERIGNGEYPMLLINPKYIESVKYKNPTIKKVRGDPADIYHFIAVHGHIGDEFCVYDCDLHHEPTETLSENNIRCTSPFPILKNFSKDINNRLYWFSLIDKSETIDLKRFENG